MPEVVVTAALVIACALAVLSAVGLALGADVYDRLHYLAPPGISAILIALALWIDVGPSLLALKATLLAAILLGGTPVLAHAISRAARIQQRGDWRWRPEEGEVEE